MDVTRLPAVEPLHHRAMTWNIHHGAPAEGAVDLEAVASVIEGSRASVVALQEVDRSFGPRSGLVDQAAWLRDRLGMELAWHTTLASETGSYGLATLSRLPMREVEGHAYVDRPPLEPRGFLVTRVRWGGTIVRIVNTHLAAGRPTARLAQARELRAYLAAEPLTPTLVLGDLNATSRSPVLRVLRGRVRAPGPAGGRSGATFPAAGPRRRIDHVLGDRRTVTSHEWVVDTAVSDHRPIVADLRRG